MLKSKSKRSIRTLLQVGKNARDIAWLTEALQNAIELEHATLPPYLTGFWSVKNNSVAQSIKNIVLDEMCHMGLVCNMLVAIGGKPEINTVGAVPTYPGHLPGDVRPELTVYLAGLSKSIVAEVYMEIEYPENGPVKLFLGETYPTIGAFYRAIAGSWEEILSDSDLITEGQLTSSVGSDVVVISTVQEGLDAIERITREGEGTSTTPFEDGDSGTVAHY